MGRSHTYFIAALVFLTISPALSQTGTAGENPTSNDKTGSFVIRIIGGGGYTLIDLSKASGYAERYLEDWDQVNYAFCAQGLYALGPNLRVGLEAGYEQLYSWYYRIPFGSQTLFREASWGMVFAGPLAQVFFSPMMYVMAGVDLHFFEDEPAIGLSTAIGAEINAGVLRIPLEVRVKPVLGTGTPTVFQLNAGIGFALGR